MIYTTRDVDTYTAGQHGCYFYEPPKDKVYFESPLASWTWEPIGVVVFDETVLQRMIKWGNTNWFHFLPDEKKDMAKKFKELRAVVEEYAKPEAARVADERYDELMSPISPPSP